MRGCLQQRGVAQVRDGLHQDGCLMVQGWTPALSPVLSRSAGPQARACAVQCVRGGACAG